MVQVDVFWSYALGAGFALAAAHQLKWRQERRVERVPTEATGEAGGLLTNPYLAGTILFCAAIFAPSGAWLLWGFPNWETMQVGDHSLPAWLVALFAATNTTQGVVGFLATQWLIGRRLVRWAALQVVAGYFAMFFILVHGWDGTGYQRFFSTDKADFRRWGEKPVLDQVGEWLTSDVALTLYGMGVVLIPVMLIMMNRWHRQGMRAAGVEGPSQLAALALALGSVGATLGAAVIASMLVHLITWVPGLLVFAAGIWVLVIRRGGLASLVVRLLGLPPDEPPGAATPGAAAPVEPGGLVGTPDVRQR